MEAGIHLFIVQGGIVPTVFTHPVPITAVALGLGPQMVSIRLLVAGIICALLPDIDVISFRFGINYADVLGHRGMTHSIVFAVIVAALGAFIAPVLASRRIVAALIMGGAVASHIFLDAMTSGGLGVAFFWPWTETRYFLPWRPIRVSPFSLQALFSEQGFTVFKSEFYFVWAPCLIFMIGAWCGRAACKWK